MQNFFLIINFCLLCMSVFAVGNFLISSLKIKFSNKTETNIFAFSAGAVLFSYIFHLLGFIGLLHSNILIAFYYFFAFYSVLIFIKSSRNLSALSRYFKKLTLKKSLGKIDFLSTPIIYGFIIFFILFPLVPYLFLYPSSWDVLAYHLPLPKFYLAQHSLEFARWFDQTGFPIGIEALYGFGEALHEPRLSNFIHFSFIIATILYILFGLKKIFSRSTRYLAIFIFLFQPMLYTEVAVSAYVDYPLAFFTLVTTMAFIKFYNDRTKGNLLLFFLLSSFLPLIKFSGIFFVISSFFILIIAWINDVNKQKKLCYVWNLKVRDWIIAGLTFIPSAYWFGRNFYYTNNPFYPFFNDIFKGIGYRAGMKQLVKDDILQNSFVVKMIKNFLTSGDTPLDYTNLAAIIFIFSGLFACFWFIKSKQKDLKVMSYLTLITLVLLLLVIGPITRYVFFVFPLISLLTSQIITEKIIQNKESSFFGVARNIFILIFVMILAIQLDSTFFARQKFYLQLPKKQWIYFMNPKTANSMLYEQDNYRIQKYVNTHLGKEEKVLQVLDNRIYYLDIPSEFANTIDGSYFTDISAKTAQDTYKRILSDGFTHVIKLDAWGAHPSMRQELFNDFMNDYIDPVATEAGVTLYKIKPMKY